MSGPSASTLYNATIEKAERNEISNCTRDMFKFVQNNYNFNNMEELPDPIRHLINVVPHFLAEVRKNDHCGSSSIVSETTGTDGSDETVSTSTYHTPQSSMLELADISDMVPANPSSLPVTSIADRYTRSMLKCLAGYPLYSPKPLSELSKEYLRNGVHVGDVGFVRGNGTFDFLFNICPPQNHFINPPKLPDGFSLGTLDHSATTDLDPLPPKTCLFHSPITKMNSGEYTCEGPEGAVLELPEGAFQEEAMNMLPFETLAARHGVEWYKYTMSRGRAISNGSLYLITSFTKCARWGIAVFDRPCALGQGLKFDSETSFPFSFWNSAIKYCWKGLNTSNTKVTNPDQGNARNQCVFLRGYKIMIRQDIFDNLRKDQLRGSHTPMPSPSPQAGSSSPTFTRQKASRIRGGGGTDPGLKGLTGGSPLIKTMKSAVMESDEVVLYPNFNSSLIHPSDLVNTALLSQNPDAKVVLTHDDVWCDLLRGNFPKVNYATLINIARLYTCTVDEDGCVSLEKVSDSSNVLNESSCSVGGTEIPALQVPVQGAGDEQHNPERVRKLWAEFEQRLKHPRNEMERLRDQLLLKTAGLNRHIVKTFQRRIEEAHFSKAREEWQRRLRVADLKDSDWGPMNEAEMKAVEEALGVDDEDGYITDPSLQPPHPFYVAASTSSAVVTPRVPTESTTNRSSSSLFPGPPMLVTPPRTSASRATRASSSSYECVRPEELHWDSEKSTSDLGFSFSTIIPSITEYLRVRSSMEVAKENNDPFLTRNIPVSKPVDAGAGGQPPPSLASPKRPPYGRQQPQATTTSRSSSNSRSASVPSPPVPTQSAASTKPSLPAPSQRAAPTTTKSSPSVASTTTAASSSWPKSQQKSSKSSRVNYPPSLSDLPDYDEPDSEDDQEDEQKMWERIRQEQLALQAQFNSHEPPKAQVTRKRPGTLTLDSMPKPVVAMSDKNFDETNEISTPLPLPKGGWSSVKAPATRSLLGQNLSRKPEPVVQQQQQQQQQQSFLQEAENGELESDHEDAERENTGFWSYLTKKKAANTAPLPQSPQSPWNFASPVTKSPQKPTTAKSRLGIVTTAWDDDLGADGNEPVEEVAEKEVEKEELPQEKTPVIPLAPAPNVSPANKKQTKKQRQTNKKGGAAGAGPSSATAAKAEKAEAPPAPVPASSSPSNTQEGPKTASVVPLGRKTLDSDGISSTPRPSILKRLQAQLANEEMSKEQADETSSTCWSEEAETSSTYCEGAEIVANSRARGLGKTTDKKVVDPALDDSPFNFEEQDELSWVEARIARDVARMALESAVIDRMVNDLNVLNGPANKKQMQGQANKTVGPGSGSKTAPVGVPVKSGIKTLDLQVKGQVERKGGGERERGKDDEARLTANVRGLEARRKEKRRTEEEVRVKDEANVRVRSLRKETRRTEEEARGA